MSTRLFPALAPAGGYRGATGEPCNFRCRSASPWSLSDPPGQDRVGKGLSLPSWPGTAGGRGLRSYEEEASCGLAGAPCPPRPHGPRAPKDPRLLLGNLGAAHRVLPLRLQTCGGWGVTQNHFSIPATPKAPSHPACSPFSRLVP